MRYLNLFLFIFVCAAFSVVLVNRERARVHAASASQDALETRCPHTEYVAQTCIHNGVIEVLYPGQKAEVAIPLESPGP